VARAKYVDALDCELVPISDELVDNRDVIAEVDRVLLFDKLHETLTTLCYRERQVLYCRFFDCLTLKAVGAKFGVSGQRIRQVEAKALRKMRHYTRSEPLLCMMNHVDAIQHKKEKEAERKAEEARREEARLEQQVQWAKDQERRKLKELKRKELVAQQKERNRIAEQQQKKKDYEEYRKEVMYAYEEQGRQKRSFESIEKQYRAEMNRKEAERAKKQKEHRQKVIEEHERKQKEKHQSYLLKMVTLQGEKYNEADIPEPPDFITLERDKFGVPFLGVRQMQYFKVSDEVYNYWLFVRLEQDRNKSK